MVFSLEVFEAVPRHQFLEQLLWILRKVPVPINLDFPETLVKKARKTTAERVS
jgi:hypothetical protein